MSKAQRIIIFIIWTAAMLWGVFGVFQRLSHGELLVNYGSYIPWGLWVAGKLYFVGMAVGSSFLAWVIYAFNIQRLRPLVRPALLISFICFNVGLLVISFDLGHMWRLYEVFTRPNFSSLLAVATWLSMLYLGYVLVVLLLDLRFGQQADHIFRPLGSVGIFFALMFSGANGAEFATLISSPYWHSALGPILSIAGALVSGIALVLAAAGLFPKQSGQVDGTVLRILSRMLVGLLLLVLMLDWSEYSVSMWYGRDESYSLLSTILFGQYWYVFWIFHLLLGTIVPLILLLWKPSHRLIAGFGGAFVAIGYFAVRLNHVIPGFVTPAMKGLQEAYMDNRLKFEYLPSIHEWAVFAFTVALGIAMFYVGSRILQFISLRSANGGGQ